MSSPYGVRLASWLTPAILVAALFTGCGGTTAEPSTPEAGSGTAAGATATPTTDGAATRSEPNAARAMEHLRVLAGDIGSRSATTAEERRAAEYIQQQLEAAGYSVTIEEFDVQATLGGSATLRLNDGSTVEAAPLNGSPNGTVSGDLMRAGLGRAGEFSAVSVAGKIALLDRGEITFGEKVRNAQAAGAIGVVVVNNEDGMFRGDLGGEPARIPAVSVARASGETLGAAGGGVTIEVQTNRVSGRSQNVVAKPSEAPCTAYLGAHYDSVPAGPGANDNASGTSLLIELARARRTDGVCVVAFGAEEVGLIGSRAFVREHDVGSAAFMMNFDMVAKATRPTFIGDEPLTEIAADVAAERDFEARTITSFGPGTSSDHASFQAAGVPALMFYSGDDEFIHTADDDLSNVSDDDLGEFLEMAVAVLDRLLAG
ncbi:MAG: M20/M25/M40 family metallo-hydrolase [Dehalococcoidia bacterium]